MVFCSCKSPWLRTGWFSSPELKVHSGHLSHHGNCLVPSWLLISSLPCSLCSDGGHRTGRTLSLLSESGFGHSVYSVLWVVLTTSCLPQNHSTTSVTVDQESHKETTDHWKISLFLCKEFLLNTKNQLKLTAKSFDDYVCIVYNLSVLLFFRLSFP